VTGEGVGNPMGEGVGNPTGEGVGPAAIIGRGVIGVSTALVQQSKNVTPSDVGQQSPVKFNP